jgi:hypothetical protein
LTSHKSIRSGYSACGGGSIKKGPPDQGE